MPAALRTSARYIRSTLGLQRPVPPLPSVVLHRQHGHVLGPVAQQVQRFAPDPAWHWALGLLLLVLGTLALGAWLTELDARDAQALGLHDAALAQAYADGRAQGRREAADLAAGGVVLGCGQWVQAGPAEAGPAAPSGMAAY